jgi:hypothetical protein
VAGVKKRQSHLKLCLKNRLKTKRQSHLKLCLKNRLKTKRQSHLGLCRRKEVRMKVDLLTGLEDFVMRLVFRLKV